MRSTVATIDLDALEWNLKTIRRKAGSAGICAMVKANAYGHGMIEVSRLLVEHGIQFLGVAFIQEAIALREAGIQVPILVLTPNESSEADAVVHYNLTPVVGDVLQAQAIHEAAARSGAYVHAHLYVDTGMHRDGVLVHDVPDVLNKLDTMSRLVVEGICTHMATADVLHDAFLTEQLDIFYALLARLQKQGRTFAHIHAANTGALWQSPQSLFTLVRPGLSLYGYASPAADELHLRPVMRLTSRVLSKRRLWPGETVSYGRRYMTTQETTICTVPIGYGDGYSRALSGKAYCIIRGTLHPVVGSICMDEVMVDVGKADVAIGDEVVFLGTQADNTGKVQSIDATDIASWAGTIPYEITTAISQRVPRIFVRGKGL